MNMLPKNLRVGFLWVVVITIVGSLAGVMGSWYAGSQDVLYETTSRYAVVPTELLRNGAPEDLTRSLIALESSTIVATAAEFLESGTVAAIADEQLGLTGGDDYDHQASVVPGSAVIQVDASGPDPATVVEYSRAVGDASQELFAGAVGAYDLLLIKAPTAPSAPSTMSSSRGFLLGAVLGVIACVAFIAFFGPVRRTGRATGASRRDDSDIVLDDERLP